MKNIHLLALFIFVLHISCSDNSKNNFSVMHTEKPRFQTISCVRLDSVSLEEIFNLWYWKIDKNRISVFSPRGKEEFLSVYSLPEFNLLFQYGSIGQGPGEYITANWGNSSVEDQILLYDMMKRNLYSFTIDNENITVKDTLSLYGEDELSSLAKPFTMIHQINDSIYLLKAEMPDNSYLELSDLKNHTILFSQAGLLKRDPDTSYTPYNYELEYMDSLVITAYNYIDRIEFFYLNENRLIDHVRIVGNSELEDKTLSVYELNNYYTDIKTDGKYIYAVYQHGENDFGPSSIEIYERSGKPVLRMELDQYIELILLSGTSGIIYAYNSTKEESLIYTYENPLYPVFHSIKATE